MSKCPLCDQPTDEDVIYCCEEGFHDWISNGIGIDKGRLLFWIKCRLCGKTEVTHKRDKYFTESQIIQAQRRLEND